MDLRIAALLSLLIPIAAAADDITGTISPPAVRRKTELVYVERAAGKFVPPREPAVMNQIGNVYQPHVLPVVEGTRVVFKSEDPELHNVFARAGPKVAFNQAVVPKSSFERVMADQGIVHLSCNIHKEMSAFIVILQNPFFATPDRKTGEFVIRGVPPGDYVLRIWGEKLSDEEKARRFPVVVGNGETRIELAQR